MSGIDMETFSKLQGRMKARFPTLLEGYLRDADRYLATISANLPGGNLPELIEAAHSLKSASGLLGLPLVHKAAETLEYAGKALKEQGATQLESLAPLYQSLKDAFSSIAGDVRAEMEKAKAGE